MGAKYVRVEATWLFQSRTRVQREKKKDRQRREEDCRSAKARSTSEEQPETFLTLSQSLCTSASASCLQLIKLSIHPSSVGMVAGSLMTGDTSVGGLPTSSILVSMSCERDPARDAARAEMQDIERK